MAQEKRKRANQESGHWRHGAGWRLYRRTSRTPWRTSVCLVEVATEQARRRLVSWRSGEAGHAAIPAICDDVLHRRCRSSRRRPAPAVQPVLAAHRCFQFDQRAHQAGHRGRGRTGHHQKTRRCRAKDRGRLRAAQCRLDDTAADVDLRSGPRHQHHAVVAADPPVRIHAAGGRGARTAATGARGGSGDRSDRRRRESCGDQQVLFAAGCGDAHLPGDDRPDIRRIAATAAHDLGAPPAVASRLPLAQAAVSRAPMSRWASA